jgi:hypothetical protein
MLGVLNLIDKALSLSTHRHTFVIYSPYLSLYPL